MLAFQDLQHNVLKSRGEQYAENDFKSNYIRNWHYIHSYISCFLYWGMRSYLSYREAYSVYIEKCEYIKDNEQAFVEFSEYCLSLVENDREDIHINDEKLWEKDENGIIVKSVVNSGKAFYRTGTGYVVHYSNDINSNYSIDIVYCLDTVRKNDIETSDKHHCVINDDMYVYLCKIPHA